MHRDIRVPHLKRCNADLFGKMFHFSLFDECQEYFVLASFLDRRRFFHCKRLRFAVAYFR